MKVKIYFSSLVVKDKCPQAYHWSEDVYDLTSVYGYPSPLWAKDLADESEKVEVLKRSMGSFIPEKYLFCLRQISSSFDPAVEAWKHFGQLIHHGQTIYINLAQSEENLLKGVKKRHKYEISQLSRNKSISVSFDLKYLNSFIESYNETMSRLSAGVSYFFKEDYIRIWLRPSVAA